MYKIIFCLLLALFQLQLLSQKLDVVVLDQEGIAVPFAQGWVLPDSISIFCNEEGRFTLQGIPDHDFQIEVSALGYQTLRLDFERASFSSKMLEIHLDPQFIITCGVVVSGTRSARSRKDLPIVVDILDQKTFDNIHAVNLSEGLNYQCGVRVESNCQTCNYSQIRMNGLGGGYSQVLVNSRPIFSSLVGLYGLEQVPAQLIDRVEVTKGGGSALFGANAIGGTVNIITKKAEENFTNVSYQSNVIDAETFAHHLQFNSSILSKSQNSGIHLSGTYSQRPEWDANDDGFSELPSLSGRQLGLGGFFKGDSWDLDYQFLGVQEDRNGGDLLDRPAHLRTQSEERRTQFLTGNIDLNYTFGDRWSSQLYSGLLHTDRFHYTGIDGEDGYGQTDNASFQAGNQWTWSSEKRNMELLFGGEYQYDQIKDEIKAYQYLVDQKTHQWSNFVEGDWKVNHHWHLLGGVRVQTHSLTDDIHVLPRMAVKYNLKENTSFRASYGRGFRPPQAFDADLHIAFSGGGISTVILDPDLKSEHSDSYQVSFDFDRPSHHWIYGLTINGFLTDLKDAFALEDGGQDLLGNTILIKKNTTGSTVMGISLDLRANLANHLEWDAGITLQQSQYRREIQWSENVPGEKSYLRTPDLYGCFTGTYFISPSWELNGSCVYTGRMLVPHFGGAPETKEDEIYHSNPFWDFGLFLKYKWPLASGKMTISAGVQNIFNSYQENFDSGKNRDSNFIYGPSRPRTFTLKVGYNLF